jgi:hypothetical protein
LILTMLAEQHEISATVRIEVSFESKPESRLSEDALPFWTEVFGFRDNRRIHQLWCQRFEERSITRLTQLFSKGERAK